MRKLVLLLVVLTLLLLMYLRVQRQTVISGLDLTMAELVNRAYTGQLTAEEEALIMAESVNWSDDLKFNFFRLAAQIQGLENPDKLAADAVRESHEHRARVRQEQASRTNP